MALPAVLARVAGIAARVGRRFLRRPARFVAPALAGAGALELAQGAPRFFGRRRRRRGMGITMNEMGKVMFLAQVLGKRNPAVTITVMKALGGKI